MISKICCCFNLRWGYYTFGIVIVGIRLLTWCFLFSLIAVLCSAILESCGPRIFHFGLFMCWCIGSFWYCFLTIEGIINKSSAMIYPCIVFLLAELVFTTILYLFVAITVTPYILVILPSSFCVYGCDLGCLISLYKKLKKDESLINILRNCNQNIKIL